MALFTTGCISIIPQQIRPDGVLPDVVFDKAVTYRPPEKTQLYKTSLEIRNYTLTGFMLIKSMSADKSSQGRDQAIYRVNFSNEIGMTYFDLEITPQRMNVISCFQSLKKRALLSILEKDFRQLTDIRKFRPDRQFRASMSDQRIVSGRTGRSRTWQTWSAGKDTLRSIASYTNFADQVIVTFSGYRDSIPGKIQIDNPFIGMKMSLRLMKNE